MSNQSTKQAHHFEVTFVRSDKGVQSEHRVRGRRGFPDKKGAHQPAVNETWIVSIGHAPADKPFLFLFCHERVRSAEDNKAVAQAAVSERPQVRTFASPAVVIVTKPADPVTRAREILAPVAGQKQSVGLGDLRRAMATKRAVDDYAAMQLRGRMSELLSVIKALPTEEAAITARLSELYSMDYEMAQGVYVHQTTQARLTVERAALKRESALYAGMCKKLKARGAAATEEERQAVQAVKANLEERRAKADSEEAEVEQKHGYDVQCYERLRFGFRDEEVKAKIDAQVADFARIDAIKQELATATAALEKALADYEQRLVQLSH
jgi:hypothetical protein